MVFKSVFIIVNPVTLFFLFPFFFAKKTMEGNVNRQIEIPHAILIHYCYRKVVQWLSPFLPDTLLNSPILVVEIGEPIITK